MHVACPLLARVDSLTNGNWRLTSKFPSAFIWLHLFLKHMLCVLFLGWIFNPKDWEDVYNICWLAVAHMALYPRTQLLPVCWLSLCTCGLLNDAELQACFLQRKDYYWTGNDMRRINLGLIWGTVLVLALRDWRKPQSGQPMYGPWLYEIPFCAGSQTWPRNTEREMPYELYRIDKFSPGSPWFF